MEIQDPDGKGKKSRIPQTASERSRKVISRNTNNVVIPNETNVCADESGTNNEDKNDENIVNEGGSEEGGESGSESGSEAGSEDDNEDGSEDDNEEDSEGGSEDGSGDGSKAGMENGSEEESEADEGEDGNEEGTEKGKRKEGEEDTEADEDDDSDMKLDFSDSKLYLSFKNHVASLLLRSKPIDRGPLTCKQAASKLRAWKLEKEHKSVQELIKGSPLYCLYQCSYRSANRVIVSGFVERWHAETNSFSMSFGEMTITLDDVQQITGLPIVGHVMSGIDKSSIPGEDLCTFSSRVLGIPKNKMEEELSSSSNRSITLNFIRNNLAGKAKVGKSKGNCTPEQVARGYLLYLLGCTLFQDKTGDSVNIKYLYYLEHWDKIGQWAWGVSGLAYLYRELGKASRLATKSISGYLTLLEAWVYEHFPSQRPIPTYKLKPGMVRTAQWKPSSHYNPYEAKKQLHYLRMQLDALKKTDVIWTPYRKVKERPPEVAWFCGAITLHEIVEPYQPDRVVRQLGYVQDIPRDPIAPNRAIRGNKAMAYAPTAIGRTDEFGRWSDHIINPANRGDRMKRLGECTTEYDDWVNSTCIRRLDLSVKDSMKLVSESDAVDNNILEAWKILDKEAGQDQEIVYASIKVAKDLIKPTIGVEEEAVEPIEDVGACRRSKRKASHQPSTSAPKRKKK